MRKEIKTALPIAEAFSKLLHPFAEVVLHDLAKDQIEAIYNPLSRRKVGDSSYLDRLDLNIDLDDNVIGPYEKTNYDGRHLKSISIILRNDSKKAVGFLCVNMDVSVFEKYHDALNIFLSNNDRSISEKKQCLFKDDLYEQINRFVQNYCQKNHFSLEALGRKEKQTIILKLKDEGALNGKNATNYIARILNISRATVYNHLKEKELL